MKQLQQGVEWSPSNVASVIYSCALFLCILQHRCQAPETSYTITPCNFRASKSAATKPLYRLTKFHPATHVQSAYGLYFFSTASGCCADAYLDQVHSEPCRMLLASLARTAEARVEEFHANAIAATLWGLTVAQQLPQPLLTRC